MDVATEQRIGSPLTTDNRTVASVAFSPDGQTLATGSYASSVPTPDVNLDDNDPIGLISAGTRPGHSVAFSPHGKILATCDDGYTARLWNAANQHQLGSPPTGRASVMSVAFSPNGKILATGDGPWHGTAVERGYRPPDRRSPHRPRRCDLVGGVQPEREDPGYRQRQ